MQFVLLQVNYEDVEVVESLDQIESERGEGGFGSTGVH